MKLERVQLAREGQSSLHIGYKQFDNGDNLASTSDDSFFATGDLQIFGQLSEFSSQYHIEKLQITKETNALDITAAAETYFFGVQTGKVVGGGYQVEADASHEKSLLIGSTGEGNESKVDTFVINGISDASDDHEIYLFGANSNDNLKLNFADGSALENVMKGEVGAFDPTITNADGSFDDANGLVNVKLEGNKATITMNNNTADDTTDDVSLNIFFQDGGNLDSTFLNKIKWES